MLRTLHGGSRTASLLFLQGGRGRRGGRRSFLALVLVVFNGSGIALLVLLVVIPLVLCSPGSTTGTWCSASPPVWTRRTVLPSWFWQWHVHGWFCSSRCVPLRCRQAQDAPHHGQYAPKVQLRRGLGFCLSRCSSRCVPSCCRLQARDARHHGRFGPEVQLRRHWWHAWLVLLVTLHPALCFFPCRQAQDARHHGRYALEGMSRVAVQKTADFPQLRFFKVVDIPVVTPRLIPMVLVTIEIPQLLDTVIDVPNAQVVFVVAQRRSSMVQTFSGPKCFPSCLTW